MMVFACSSECLDDWQAWQDVYALLASARLMYRRCMACGLPFLARQDSSRFCSQQCWGEMRVGLRRTETVTGKLAALCGLCEQPRGDEHASECPLVLAVEVW